VLTPLWDAGDGFMLAAPSVARKLGLTLSVTN
jgi:hypothetical protein